MDGGDTATVREKESVMTKGMASFLIRILVSTLASWVTLDKLLNRLVF